MKKTGTLTATPFLDSKGAALPAGISFEISSNAGHHYIGTLQEGGRTGPIAFSFKEGAKLKWFSSVTIDGKVYKARGVGQLFEDSPTFSGTFEVTENTVRTYTIPTAAAPAVVSTPEPTPAPTAYELWRAEMGRVARARFSDKVSVEFRTTGNLVEAIAWDGDGWNTPTCGGTIGTFTV